jgi:hypothetical protein|tara:strand:+ start:220 stop:681 length:462 start_codon:yes stop_codon:yes gene_type:complete
MTLISGKAYWASITAPNTTYEPCWTIDVTLDEENYKKVIADGVPVKNKSDERGNFVTIKRKLDGKHGPNTAPELVDAQRQPMFNTLIGNGSDVNVLYRPYDWNHEKRSGRSADLQKVQVVNLIVYEPKDSQEPEDFEVLESGYTSDDDIPFAS